MSFWSAEDKIPVRQTKVAIQAEHGLDYTAGQKITIVIPPTIQYFQPRESYLSFDLLLKQGGLEPQRVQLDSDAGAQMLIKDLRILSGGAGAQLLEEYQDYNVLATLRYDYESDATLRAKRALTEGTTDYDQTTRGTRGTTKSRQAGLAHNPYFNPYAVGDTPDSTTDGGVWGDADSVPVGTGVYGDGPKKVKCLMPIHTGIFQNSKVFPTLLTEGLRVEILLEDAPKVMKMLDSTNKNNRQRLGPILHSVGAAEGGKDAYIATKGAWNSNPADATEGIKASDTFWFKRENNVLDMDNFPLVVGESFNLVGQTAGNGGLTNPIEYHGLQGFPKFTTPSGANKLIIKSIVKVAGAADPTTQPAGSEHQGGNWGLIKVVTTEAATLVAGTGATAVDKVEGSTGSWVAFSTANALSAAVGAGYTEPSPGYSLSNVELILQQLEMPAGYTRKMMSMMKAGGAMNYDFQSVTNYKYSQLAGDIVANIRLPLSQSRAKAILSVPTDATRYTNLAYMRGSKDTAGSNGSADTWTSPYAPANWTYLDKPGVMVSGTSVANSDKWATATNQGKSGTIETPDGEMYSTRAGMVGIWDYLTNYQWFYNGQLNPNRAVDTSKISSKQSICQQPLVELEKALAMSGIRPLSFAKYASSAVIGRALSLQDGVYDTRGRDFNLQVNYQGTAPEKNKLWCNYVSHIRRLTIRGDSIQLQI